MAITRFKLDQTLRQTLSSGATLLTPNYRLAASVLEAYGSASPTASWTYQELKRPNPPTPEMVERAKFVDKTYNWKGK